MKHQNPVPTRVSPYEVLKFATVGVGASNRAAGAGGPRFPKLRPGARPLGVTMNGGNGRRRMHLPPRGESLQ